MDFIENFSLGLCKKNQIKGKMYQSPEGFIVSEISLDGFFANPEEIIDFDLKGPEKKYIKFILIKKNIDTLEAIRRLSSLAGIPKDCIGRAGLKDTLGITGQWVSVPSEYKDKLFNFFLKQKDDLFITKPFYSDSSCSVRNLKGNSFKISINADEEENSLIKKLDHIKNYLEKNPLPNFYGPQRFGKNQKGQEVGKNLLKGNYEKALKIFCTEYSDYEPDNIKEIKNKFKENWGDWEKCYSLSLIDNRLFQEGYAFDSLKKGKDYLQAFNSTGFTNFYISSYSSYLFNLVLRKLLEKKYSFLPEKVPLIGYGISLGKDEISKYLYFLLAQDNLDTSDFYNKKIPELSFKGRLKKSSYYVEYFSYKIKGKKIILTFDLPMGVYASLFLDYFFQNKLGDKKIE